MSQVTNRDEIRLSDLDLDHVDISTTAAYEFIKSLLLSAKTKFVNFDGRSKSGKYINTAGDIVGGAVGLAVPLGIGRLAATGVAQPLYYHDMKKQKQRKDMFISVLNSPSKYLEDNFRQLFIQIGVSIYKSYEMPLRKINFDPEAGSGSGTGLNDGPGPGSGSGSGESASASANHHRENKRQAMQKLGKYAGRKCIKNIIKLQSIDVDTLVSALAVESGHCKLVKKWKVKNVKLYYWATKSKKLKGKKGRDSEGENQELEIIKKKKKKITAPDFFSNTIPSLLQDDIHEDTRFETAGEKSQSAGGETSQSAGAGEMSQTADRKITQTAANLWFAEMEPGRLVAKIQEAISNDPEFPRVISAHTQTQAQAQAQAQMRNNIDDGTCLNRNQASSLENLAQSQGHLCCSCLR